MRSVRFMDGARNVRTGEWVDEEIVFSGETIDPDDVTILPPTEPTKIVCIGRNYVPHAEEHDNPVPKRPLLFLKGPNAVTAHNATIELPANKDWIDFEAELGIVIGKQCKNVSAEDADDVIAGYTCVNEVSNRDDQRYEGATNWVRGKGFDNSLPFGPAVVSTDLVPDDAYVEGRKNGEVYQRDTIDNLIFSIPELVEAITELITLEPGDIIPSGTPKGPERIEDGDTVEIEVEGVGTLRNDFVKA